MSWSTDVELFWSQSGLKPDDDQASALGGFDSGRETLAGSSGGFGNVARL